MPPPPRPGDQPHRTGPGRAVEWDCRNGACGHTSVVHTVDEADGLGPLHPQARFRCEVDGCGCAQLVPAPQTLRSLGVHPSQVGQLG